MATKTAYENLKERFAQMSNLQNAGSILGKDMETTMTSGSTNDRIEQITAIAMASHHLMTDPQVEEWLDRAESDASNFSSEDRRNLDLMRRDWIHGAALPADLAKAEAELSAKGERMHVEHFQSGDWSKMKDWYEHSFNIAREVGDAKKDKLGLPTIYDALVDTYSPGIRVSVIETEFAALDQELRNLIPAAVAKQKQQAPTLPLKGPFPAQQQMELATRVATAMGFDFNRGGLFAIDGHPSSGGSSDDNRITTRCKEGEFFFSLYSSIHEAGHGMYSQNEPLAWRYQPIGGHLGMSVHESQSRIMECNAAMTDEFIEYLSVQANDIFGSDPSLSAGNLKKHIHKVEPSFIRIAADELTYSMHVILRFGLEKAIIEGKLDAKDLPEAWNAGMKEKLGVIVPGNEKGCMQDVHYPIGSVGYFPSYALGSMLAAQFFAAAERANPNLRTALGKGDFQPLATWLHDNVHSQGSIMPADQMIKQATGEGLNAKHYLDHFKARYL